MSGVLGLIVFDEAVVGVALPTMRPELGMTLVASHWVVNAYLLTFTCFVAIAGRLGDALGHRDLFVAGIVIFGLASLVAGFAPNGAWLIAARAVQGIGAAVIFPSSWAMMTTNFPPERRGFAFGIQTTVGGIFMSAGPFVGGLFVAMLSWRWIFWINLPIVAAIAVIAIAAGTQPFEAKQTGPSAPKAGLDLVGPAALVLGLVALVLVLMEGAGWGWSGTATLALFCGAAVLLALFVVVETRRSDPLIELDLLRIATFTGGNLVFFAFQFNKVIVFVFGPLYLQEILHRSPELAGFIVTAAVLPTLVTSVLCGKLVDRVGTRGPMLIGLLLNGSAVAFISLATVYDSDVLILAPLFLWGATLPFVAIGSRRALLGAVPPTKQSQASGINLTIQMLGGTIGMAICSALFAVTGSFGLVFLLTGAVVLATFPVAMLMIERPFPRGASKV